MSFLHPEFLYYMLPIVLILFALLLTQKESHATFFSAEVMDKLRVSANTLTLKARNALFGLMAILIVIALAGPVIKEGKVEVKAKSADIMIALDISDSMLAEDVYPNRLKLAKQKGLELLKIAPNERIGVIAFARNSYLVSPLSFDHNAVAFLLRQLNTESITEKGTNFYSMLEVVDRSIKKESQKYLLILSDGGDEKDFSREIAFAKEHHITVYILGIGTPKGAPIRKENGEFIKQNGEIIVSRLNENIVDLATKTGGVYIENVTSDKDIKAMLHEIETHSKKTELKSEEIERFTPLFYFPLGLAMLLLLIATSSMSKRESVMAPNILVFFALLFSGGSLKAGLLDFQKLDNAKQAYESGQYEKAAQTYRNYAEQTKKGESFYNAGNSFYKQGKYDEAIKSYQRATFDKKDERANNFANLGNAYVKKKDKKSLEEAIKAYESSLKLHEDKEVKENLEAVKKFLEQQKKKEQKKQDQKEKQSKKDKKEKQSKKDKKESDKKDKKKDSKDGEKKDSQEKSDKEQNSSKSQKDKEKQKSQQDMKSKKEQDDKENSADKDGKKQEQKEQLKQLKNEKHEQKKKDEKQKTSAMQATHQEDKMSDAEEAKWLKQLNKQPNTYLYMLNKQNNKYEEDSDAKPW